MTITTDQNHCHTCGALLWDRYYYLQDRSERYCRACMTDRPRCDACAAPVTDTHWRLHDGRVLCQRCHTTAVYAPEQAQQLFAATQQAIAAQLGLQLNIGVHFRLVDAPTIAAFRQQGVGTTEERTLGLYQRQGRLRVIYALYGLPLLTFRMVVAHELGHAWEAEHCPLLEDDRLREGFAEWVAYKHLLYLGCTIAADRMLHTQHPYRPFLETVLQIEQVSGPTGVLQHLQTQGYGG